MWDTSLDESQAGVKAARRNINSLSYADDAALMAEGEDELKSLLKKGKEKSENAGLKLNIQKTKIMACSLNTWNREVKRGSNDRLYWTDTVRAGMIGRWVREKGQREGKKPGNSSVSGKEFQLTLWTGCLCPRPTPRFIVWSANSQSESIQNWGLWEVIRFQWSQEGWTSWWD